MNNSIIIIFSGFNPRAVISLLRTLINNNLDFKIIAKSDEDFIFYTEYAKNVISVRKNLKLDFDSIREQIGLVKQQTNADSIFIAPTTEALNRFLLNERFALEAINVKIPLVNENLYELISDKYSFSEVCKNHNILVPQEFPSIEHINYPFVAKPKSYFGNKGEINAPQLIFNEKEKYVFLSVFSREDFYYQEYIKGESYYLLYYFSKNGSFYKYSQQNIAQQPFGKSILAAISSDFHLSEESKKYEELFISLGFHGLIMVEVKRYNNRNYMIEANPRFWGPSQLFVDANVNFFETLLYDYNFILKKPKISKKASQTKYFWFGGYQNVINNKETIDYHDYDVKKIKFDVSSWLDSDIYKREDTLEYFKREIDG